MAQRWSVSTSVPIPALAALLAVVSMTSGCSAGTMTPQAAKPAGAIETTTAAKRPAPVADDVLPPALRGRWQPVSKALEGAGPLVLTAQTLRWAPCGSHARTAVVQARGGAAVLLIFPDHERCRLDDSAVTHLRLRPRSASACEMELSAYESAAQLARQERLAWGVYARQDCAASTR